MEKTRKLKKNYKIKRKCYPLLCGMNITSTFDAISSSKTTKINRTESSWTCSTLRSQVDIILL